MKYIINLNYDTISIWPKAIAIYLIKKDFFNDFKEILVNILNNDKNIIIIETVLIKIFENGKDLF